MRQSYPMIVVVIALVLAGCGGRAEPTPTVSNEPIVTMYPTPTTNPLAITIAPTSTPVAPKRVSFAVGTYGATLTGTGEAWYTLWAAKGQRFSVTINRGNCSAQLRDHDLTSDGKALTTTLQSTGDHVLGVRCIADYSISVDIR